MVGARQITPASKRTPAHLNFRCEKYTGKSDAQRDHRPSEPPNPQSSVATQRPGSSKSCYSHTTFEATVRKIAVKHDISNDALGGRLQDYGDRGRLEGFPRQEATFN